MRDRRPYEGYAGRIKLVEENTTEQRYFYMQMADNPVSGYEGTPLNKATLLSDDADEAVFGVINDIHTVSDAFEHLGSSRVRPYDDKLYTFYPDLKHPYIEFSEYFGSDAKSHIVVSKNHYMYQSGSLGSSQVTFKIFPKTDLRASAAVTFNLTDTIDITSITSFKGDPNGDIIEIAYRAESDGSGLYRVCWINASDPTTFHVYDYTGSTSSETYRPYLIHQNNTYFWTFQRRPDHVYYMAKWSISSLASLNNPINSNTLTLVENQDDSYSVSKIIRDDTYFYFFTDHYQSRDSETENNSYKVFRYNISDLDRRALRVFLGESEWNTESKWLPHWIDNGKIYFRVGTGSSTVTYKLYSAVVDDEGTSQNRKIIFTQLNSNTLSNVDTYVGHIDNTKVLFAGVTGAGASKKANARVITISNDTASFGTNITSTVIPDADSQKTSIISVRERIKHILPTSPFVPIRTCGALSQNGSSYLFKHIYAPKTSNGWEACSTFAIDHQIDGTDTISILVNAPDQFTILISDDDKSDIRYLPGYFREGRTT